MLAYLFKKFKSYKSNCCLINNNNSYSYCDLYDLINKYNNFYKKNNIHDNDIIFFESKLTINSLALFLLLLNNKNIVIPINIKSKLNRKEIYKIVQPTIILKFNGQKIELERTNFNKPNPLLKNLQLKKKSGIILFTSGTSGPPKAILHDTEKILKSYKSTGRKHITFLFMSHDHIGGLNTIFYNLFNGGTFIINTTYQVHAILDDIQKYKATLLPTTPSFLNLMLLSKSFNNYNLSSLKLITYGTEPMDSQTLLKLNKSLPKIKLRQTYGMTEIGILDVKSKSSASLEICITKNNHDYKIIDDILYIKSDSSMLGYLNYQSPFTDDGWINTGDKVKINGKYMTILGRESELINVGGEKVYPIEVEDILKEIKNISDVIVYGKNNRILGQIVAADIKLSKPVSKTKDFIISIKKYCSSKLDNYKVPMQINLVNKIHLNDRFKKVRS